MKKITISHKMFFDGHPSRREFHFTSDGQGFFEQHGASAHAQELEKKTKGAGEILSLTRDEVIAWWKEELPKLVAAASAKVTTAENAMEAARKNLEELPAKSPAIKRQTAQIALDKRGEEHEKAVAELAALQAELGKLTEKEAPKKDGEGEGESESDEDETRVV